MKEIKGKVTDSIAGAIEHMAKMFHMTPEEFISLTMTQEMLRAVVESGVEFPNHKKVMRDIEQTKEYFNNVLVPKIQKLDEEADKF
jgi:hypothetical protein